MNQNLDKIVVFYRKQDPIIFFSVLISLICSVITALVFLINFQNLPQSLPLFYSLSWGEGQLISTPQFIILPSLILLITLLNLIISWQLHPSQQVIKRIIAFSTAGVGVLITLTALKIIYIFI